VTANFSSLRNYIVKNLHISTDLKLQILTNFGLKRGCMAIINFSEVTVTYLCNLCLGSMIIYTKVERKYRAIADVIICKTETVMNGNQYSLL